VSHRLQLWKDRDTIGAPEKENPASIAAVTVQASSISEFCGYENGFTGGRVRGNTQIHSVKKFVHPAARQVCSGGHRLQGYRCSSKLGSISLSEGILGSYLPTIPSFSEYFDSNAAETTDDGQTLSKTEIGQTVSTNHKAVTQSRAYLSNEFLGLSKSFQDCHGRPRIRMENTID
jgi:hypothetical protein